MLLPAMLCYHFQHLHHKSGRPFAECLPDVVANLSTHVKVSWCDNQLDDLDKQSVLQPDLNEARLPKREQSRNRTSNEPHIMPFHLSRDSLCACRSLYTLMHRTLSAGMVTLQKQAQVPWVCLPICTIVSHRAQHQQSFLSTLSMYIPHLVMV